MRESTDFISTTQFEHENAEIKPKQVLKSKSYVIN